MTDSSSEESETCGDFLDLDEMASARAARQAKNSLVVDAGTTGRVSHCSSESSTHGPDHIPDDSSLAASNRHHQRRNRDKSRTDRLPSNHNQRGLPKGSHSSRGKRHEGLPTINDFSSSYSSTTNKRQSNLSSNSIIMAKLEELSRLLAARPTATHQDSSLSYSVSRADTYTTHTGVKSKVPESDRKTGSGPLGRGGECVVAYADIPKRPIERMRGGDTYSGDSRKAMPGGFYLDDPVRLYQQAMQLEANHRIPTSSSSQISSPIPQDSPSPQHTSPQNTTPSPKSYTKRVKRKDLAPPKELAKELEPQALSESTKRPQDSSPRVSTKDVKSSKLELESYTPIQSSPNFTKRVKTMDCTQVSVKSSSARVPSLCALCRFYWRVTRRYLNAYSTRLD